jgi:hypothetical protein
MSERPLIITPFQIFSHQMREQAVRMNPHAKGIAITHILGQMWRALDPVARNHFAQLSFQMRGHPQARIPEHYSVTRARDALALRVPILGIQSHKSFGHFAAEVSQQILLAGHGPAEVF